MGGVNITAQPGEPGYIQGFVVHGGDGYSGGGDYGQYNGGMNGGQYYNFTQILLNKPPNLTLKTKYKNTKFYSTDQNTNFRTFTQKTNYKFTACPKL